MISCLQGYLNTGLVKAKFVNLKIRQLSAESSHEFIEWCGIIEGTEPNRLLEAGVKLYKQELFNDFINEYPDYGSRSKMTISRTRFYKWLISYAMFKEGVMPEDGRDMSGRWMKIRTRHDTDSITSET
jgi:hypothetical protein